MEVATIPVVLVGQSYFYMHQPLNTWLFENIIFELQSVIKIFAKGPKIHKLKSSLSPAINVELQEHFKQSIHGCNIDCGGKGTPSAWKGGLPKIFCHWLSEKTEKKKKKMK